MNSNIPPKNHIFSDYGPDSSRPIFTVLGLTLLSILFIVDLIHHLTLFPTISNNFWFEIFHSSHNFFALLITLYLAYYQGVRIGMGAIIFYFALHVIMVFIFPRGLHEIFAIAIVLMVTVFSIRIISISHKNQAALEELAAQDPLTKAFNRRHFNESLDHQLALAKRNLGNGALVIMDINNFKQLNDTIGHLSGDTVLIEIASRLQENIRKIDLAFRIGGDEFAIIMVNPTSLEDALDRVAQAIKQPILLDNGNEIVVTGSFGASLYPEHGTDVNVIFQLADVAMFKAKSNGADYFIHGS